MPKMVECSNVRNQIGGQKNAGTKRSGKKGRVGGTGKGETLGVPLFLSNYHAQKWTSVVILEKHISEKEGKAARNLRKTLSEDRDYVGRTFRRVLKSRQVSTDYAVSLVKGVLRRKDQGGGRVVGQANLSKREVCL